MQTTVYELLAKFKGDTTDLEKSLGRAKSAYGQVAKVIGALSGAAFTGLTVASYKAIDANDDLAKSLGITYKSLVNLSLVAKEAGVEQGGLVTAITMTQRSLSEAANGVQTYAEVYDRLNLSAKELINLSPDQQFEKILAALSKIENPTVRTAMAMDLFGRNGRQVALMAEDFAAKMQDATAYNEKFGLSLDQNTVEKVTAASDAFQRLGGIASGIGNVIAVETAPAVIVLSEAILKAQADGSSFRTVLSGIMEVGISVGEVLSRAFHVVFLLMPNRP